MQIIKLALFAFLLTGISVCNNGQQSSEKNTKEQDADQEANEALQKGKQSLEEEEEKAFHALERKLVNLEELMGEIKMNRDKLSQEENLKYEKLVRRYSKIEEILYKKEQAKKSGKGDMDAIQKSINEKIEPFSDSLKTFHNSLDLE